MNGVSSLAEPLKPLANKLLDELMKQLPPLDIPGSIT